MDPVCEEIFEVYRNFFGFVTLLKFFMLVNGVFEKYFEFFLKTLHYIWVLKNENNVICSIDCEKFRWTLINTENFTYHWIMIDMLLIWIKDGKYLLIAWKRRNYFRVLDGDWFTFTRGLHYISGKAVQNFFVATHRNSHSTGYLSGILSFSTMFRNLSTFIWSVVIKGLRLIWTELMKGHELTHNLAKLSLFSVGWLPLSAKNQMNELFKF